MIKAVSIIKNLSNQQTKIFIDIHITKNTFIKLDSFVYANKSSFFVEFYTTGIDFIE